MKPGYALVTVSEDDRKCALDAERMYLDGYRPILVHRTSEKSAIAVAQYLKSRPSRLPVRLSEVSETADEFNAAVRKQADAIHVYCEEVCDLCGALPPLFSVNGEDEAMCAACAHAKLNGSARKK